MNEARNRPEAGRGVHVTSSYLHTEWTPSIIDQILERRNSQVCPRLSPLASVQTFGLPDLQAISHAHGEERQGMIKDLGVPGACSFDGPQ